VNTTSDATSSTADRARADYVQVYEGTAVLACTVNGTPEPGLTFEYRVYIELHEGPEADHAVVKVFGLRAPIPWLHIEGPQFPNVSADEPV
jgi:hypothetical protein